MFKSFFKPKNQTANIDDKLPPTISIAGSTLIRNGIGVRKRNDTAIYRVALYLSEPSDDAQSSIHLAGCKQIRMHAMRDISGATLATVFINGIKSNTPIEQQKLFFEHLNIILKIFQDGQNMPADSVVNIDLIPDKGAFFYLNHKLLSEGILIDGFNEAILKIWLGDKPSDPDAKIAMHQH